MLDGFRIGSYHNGVASVKKYIKQMGVWILILIWHLPGMTMVELSSSNYLQDAKIMHYYANISHINSSNWRPGEGCLTVGLQFRL